MTNRTDFIKYWKENNLSESLDDNCRRFVESLSSNDIWTSDNVKIWYSTGQLGIDERFKEVNDAVDTALDWLATRAGLATGEVERLETVRFIASIKYDIVGMVLRHLRNKNVVDENSGTRVIASMAATATTVGAS